MNDLTYVQTTSSTKSETNGCARCHPPVLCARHTLALTALRRQREATLLRGAPTPIERAA